MANPLNTQGLGPASCGNGFFGPKYFGVFEDFLGSPEFPTTTPSNATVSSWTRTLVNTSVSVYQAAGLGMGGILLATNDTAQNDAQQYQLEQEIFMLFGPGTTQYPYQGGLDAYCEIRMAIGDTTNMDVGFGLAITDSSQIASVATDSVSLRKVNKTTFSMDGRKVSSSYAGADATSFLTVPDTKFHTYCIEIRPYNDLSTGGVHIFMDGKTVASFNRKDGNPITLPLVSLAPWFGQLSHAASMTGANLVVQYDYIAAWQKRPKTA